MRDVRAVLQRICFRFKDFFFWKGEGNFQVEICMVNRWNPCSDWELQCFGTWNGRCAWNSTQGTCTKVVKTTRRERERSCWNLDLELISRLGRWRCDRCNQLFLWISLLFFPLSFLHVSGKIPASKPVPFRHNTNSNSVPNPGSKTGKSDDYRCEMGTLLSLYLQQCVFPWWIIQYLPMMLEDQYEANAGISDHKHRLAKNDKQNTGKMKMHLFLGCLCSGQWPSIFSHLSLLKLIFFLSAEKFTEKLALVASHSQWMQGME